MPVEVLVNIPLIDLRLQYMSIKKEIDAAIANVLENSAFVGGKHVLEFEEAFAAFCRTKHCVGVGNGTDALFIVLKCLGVGPGDEVITVANSFIATAEAASLTGAKVVFVDCDDITYTIDIKQVESAISDRTKAIIPVHLYGHPANMEELMKVADGHGLHVVEDAAQAHGSEVRGKRVGTFGVASCFSFYPGKNLGAYGDAGAIVTDDAALAARCRMFANHGRLKKYDHELEGVNSRLDGLQAAVLTVKLKYLEGWTEKRRSAAQNYRELLGDGGLILPVEKPEARHVYHLFVVRVPNRDKVQAHLKEKGIATGIHYPISLPNLQAYKYLGYKPENFPLSSKFSNEILSLPMYPELTRSQIEYISSSVLEAIGL